MSETHCRQLDKPMIGICRRAVLTLVASGSASCVGYYFFLEEGERKLRNIIGQLFLVKRQISHPPRPTRFSGEILSELTEILIDVIIKMSIANRD